MRFLLFATFALLLLAATSAHRYNISIAPLVDAIKDMDARYREWHDINAVLSEEEVKHPLLKHQWTLHRAVAIVWADREPAREVSCELDGHMKQLLLDEIVALVKQARPDLSLTSSTRFVRVNCNTCSEDGACTAMGCPVVRRNFITITRAPGAQPQSNDDLPLLHYVVKGWTDEEMRARWFCSVNHVFGDDCDLITDIPSIADAVN